MTILTCHLLHYDCMTRTDDISGLMHTSAKYALMTSADSDEISGIVHTSAYLQLDYTGNLLSIDCKLCPLIITPLTIIRLQTKLKLTNCNPNYKFEIV